MAYYDPSSSNLPNLAPQPPRAIRNPQDADEDGTEVTGLGTDAQGVSLDFTDAQVEEFREQDRYLPVSPFRPPWPRPGGSEGKG